MMLVKIREKAQITIPKEGIRASGLRVGDLVELEIVGNRKLRLTPKMVVDRPARRSR